MKKIEIGQDYVVNVLATDDALMKRLLAYQKAQDKKGRNWAEKPYRGKQKDLVQIYNTELIK